MMHLSNTNELVCFLFQDFDCNSGNVFPPTNSCPALSSGPFVMSCGVWLEGVGVMNAGPSRACSAQPSRPGADPGGFCQRGSQAPLDLKYCKVRFY